MRKLSFTLCLGMALGLSAARPAEVTIGSLLREMADRSVLARYPAPEYRTRQASSYDRASVQPGEASWFANWDRSQFLRTDSVQGRREFVLLDADGPGAVVRFWATVADYGGQGTLRMYFDHDTVPAIEGEVLSLLSGGALAPAPLSASVSESRSGVQCFSSNFRAEIHEAISVPPQAVAIRPIGTSRSFSSSRPKK